MFIKGKTKEDIAKEEKALKDKEALDKVQYEVEEELKTIIRSMAIEKYIEKQKGI